MSQNILLVDFFVLNILFLGLLKKKVLMSGDITSGNEAVVIATK